MDQVSEKPKVKEANQEPQKKERICILRNEHLKALEAILNKTPMEFGVPITEILNNNIRVVAIQEPDKKE